MEVEQRREKKMGIPAKIERLGGMSGMVLNKRKKGEDKEEADDSSKIPWKRMIDMKADVEVEH